MVKNPPAMQETWVQTLGWEGPLEKETATHFSVLAWRNPWTEESGRLQSMVAKSRTWLSDFHFFMFLILAASLSPYLIQDVKHEALDKMFSKQLLMFSFQIHPRITTNSFRWPLSFYFLKTGTINAFHPPECLMFLTTPQRSWTVI